MAIWTSMLSSLQPAAEGTAGNPRPGTHDRWPIGRLAFPAGSVCCQEAAALALAAAPVLHHPAPQDTLAAPLQPPLLQVHQVHAPAAARTPHHPARC